MLAELRLHACYKGEEVANRGDYRIHIEIDVIPIEVCQIFIDRTRASYPPIASERSLARSLVSLLEFSVPI